MEYELSFDCEKVDGMVWIKYGDLERATLDFPFADLNDDEFYNLFADLDFNNLYPGGVFFAYPTKPSYYECDDDDDMDIFNFYDR